jgi:carotenoid cleavage dioxygenase-like enzyme
MKATVHARHRSLLPAGDDHPYRTGAWRPQTTEWDASDLDVMGEIPRDLAGVYLRNTENPLIAAGPFYHPFDGDGMLHAIAFREGAASYRNRFVRTLGLAAEQAASLHAAASSGPASRSARSAPSGRTAGARAAA